MTLIAAEARPSVPPKQRLLASLLLGPRHDNLLCRWFVGLSPDDPITRPNTDALPRPQADRRGDAGAEAGS